MMHAGLAGEGGVSELLRYEVGPSIAAHTGLGTVGAVFAPADEL
jgi:fatty acid-binding protein DegV